jgi:lipoate-protein ligase A
VVRTWRLLIDAAASGPWNMGVDEALLASAARDGVAALRFYDWRGVWLSVGYAQEIDAPRRAACRAAGVGVVRRATGGRAVLHGGDLTYAIAAPGDALPHGLRASYGLVSDALCEALRALGVAADRVPGTRTRAAEGAFDCFATPAADEICVGARKLVGSAQRRAGGAVLQHGSLRVRPDSARARRAAGLDADGATSLCELGVRTRIPELRDACVEALCRALGGDFEVGTLTERERSWAAAGARRRRQEAAGLECSPPTGISRVPVGNR